MDDVRPLRASRDVLAGPGPGRDNRDSYRQPKGPAMHRISISAAAAVLLFGCASIDSSESSSDSVAGLVESLASPFESSSASSESGGGEAQTAYLQDVQAYTLAYLVESAEDGEFARGLSQVADGHGINDWEADAETFVAIRTAAGDPRVTGSARARLERELRVLESRN